MADRTIMSVDETLAKLIYNWPTLYRSRAAALERAVTSYEWNEDGTPVVEGLEQASTQSYDIEDFKKTEKSARRVLFALRENAKFNFVRDNAELLAVEEYSNFTSVPDFCSYKLNHIPLEKLREDWRVALIEYCNAILIYDEKQIIRLSYKYTAEYVARYRSQLKTAQDTAHECKARLATGTSEEASKQRNEEIQKLRYAAEKFGLKLMPIGENDI